MTMQHIFMAWCSHEIILRDHLAIRISTEIAAYDGSRDQEQTSY